MALQKPQIPICIDGKGHVWMIVAEDAPRDAQSSKIEHRWCKKCGCLTQVGFNSQNQPVVAVDDSGYPHMAIPKILDLLIK